MARLDSNRLRLALLFLPVTLAAYLPALGGGFIWNDSDYVTRPALRGIGGLWRIWFDVGATQQYYPLLHSAFWLEHRLWGDAAFGYHLVNVLLHATAACLLVTVLRNLVAREPAPGQQGTGNSSFLDGPLLAGLIFALHPVCVESVAWISEQKNTLSTVFYLLAALAYLKWSARRPGASLYFLGLALFIAALLSKTVTATLPGALLVVLWWRKGRHSWREDVLPLVPWFAIGAASGLFTGWVEKRYVGAHGAAFDIGLAERCLVAGRGAWFYLGKLVWPADLIFIYPRWDFHGAGALQFLWPIGVLAMIAALWAIRARTRAPLAALLFFLGSLFPVCGFFNLYAFIYSYVADHWQYLPCIGIISLAALGWEKAIGSPGIATPGPSAKRPPPPPNHQLLITNYSFQRIVPLVVICALAILTYRQSGMYRDIETFYRRTIERNPDCWMAENNLGVTLENEGRLDEAYLHYNRVLRIQPDARAHYNMGVILRRQGRKEGAVAQFEESLRLDSTSADAHNNLGSTLGELGRTRDAVAQFRLAAAIEPDSAKIRQNLGVALAQEGDFDGAIDSLRQALRILPDFAECQANLAAVLRHEGRYPEAIAALRRAVRIDPRVPETHLNLATALAIEKEYDAAEAELRAAVGLNPNYAEAHFFLGAVLARMGRIEEARRELNEALRINPGFEKARESLDRLPPPAGPAE